MRNKFSERLKALREYKNIKQSELGKYLGYGATAISSYENRRNEPSMDTLIQISEYFETTVGYLLGVEDCQKRREQLSKEEVNLLNGYHKLTAENKNLVLSLIKSLGREVSL